MKKKEIARIISAGTLTERAALVLYDVQFNHSTGTTLTPQERTNLYASFKTTDEIKILNWLHKPWNSDNGLP